MVAAAESPAERGFRLPGPVTALATATAIGLILLAGLGLYLWSASRSVAAVREQGLRSLRRLALAGNISENRESAARIAAATADERWRDRYAGAKSAWETALAEFRRVSPSVFTAEPGRRLTESSTRLLEMEKQAFDLERAGQRDRAHALLFGEAYERQENVQRASEKEIAVILQGRLQALGEEQRRRGAVAITSFCITFPLLLTAWILSLRSTIRHLAEQRRSDARLQESEQRLATLFEGIDDALLVHDRAGQILDCNSAACRRLGYSREELLQLHTSDIDSPEFANGFAQRCARQMASKVYICEGEHIARDGRRIPVDINTRVIVYRGVEVVLAAIRDITERKRVEAELELMREAADSASAAKSEFLANMSHEIRTPMNGILGMTELALATPLNGEQREYLQMVKVSTDSLLTVINDILDFSKIEAGRLSIEPVEFPLRDTLAEMMKALAFRAQEKGLDLAYRVPPDIPDQLVGDAGRIKQVIVNLIGNAIKFTERGEIVAGVAVDSREGDEMLLRFTIADTGIGIPANRLSSIFEPFRQADGSTTRKYGGTGLGLTISAQLAGLMGGRIRAESEVGKGSAFHFTARLKVAAGSAAGSAPSCCALDGLSVLMIDENATCRAILQEMLSAWRMAPVAVDGPAAALDAMDRARAAGAPFGMIVLDSKTPDRSLDALAASFRRLTPVGGPPVILLTPAGAVAEAERFHAFGIRAQLRKPIRQSELLDAMMTVIAAESLDRFHAFRAQGAEPFEAEPHSPARSLRILVAEDNPVNQRLLLRMLEKQNHSVALVSNGRQAVEMLGRQSFDLALLDVQMPEMSGLEVAAAVRAREKESGGGERLPLAAITANAMKGDREQCLAAGMDAYIAKPIHPEELISMIENMVIIQTPDAAISFDGSLFEGDPEFLTEIVNLFLETYPGLLSEIDEAVVRRDAAGLRRAAHTIKGAVSNFGARKIVEQAKTLEAIGRSGNLERAAPTAAALRSLMQTFAPELVAAAARAGDKQVFT